MLGQMAGSGYRAVAVAGPARRRADTSAHAAALPDPAGDRRRARRRADRDRSERAVRAQPPASGCHATGRLQAPPARTRQSSRRVRAGVEEVQPALGAPVQVGGQRSRRDQPPHAPLRRALPSGDRGAGRRRVRRDLRLDAVRERARVADAPRVPNSRAPARGFRTDGPVRRVPRVRARRRGAVRRGDARRDGCRPLPGVAGVLHGRHGQLPARARRPDPHRPRRDLLQRHLHDRVVRAVVGHGLGRVAAHRARPGTADAPAAHPVPALRRLSHPRRRDRCARPVPPHQADAARPAPSPLERSRVEGAQTLGASGRRRMGVARGPGAGIQPVAVGARATAARRHRRGQPATGSRAARRRVGGRGHRRGRRAAVVDRGAPHLGPRDGVHRRAPGGARHGEGVARCCGQAETATRRPLPQRPRSSQSWCTRGGRRTPATPRSRPTSRGRFEMHWRPCRDQPSRAA